MENANTCQEKTGLFLVDTCEQMAVENCRHCSKAVCKSHTFVYGSGSVLTKVCLTCKTALDPRLTSEIELYSADRAIWRKKMGIRFHNEYPYLVLMADQYDTLFDTMTYAGIHDTDTDSSPFES